MEILLFTILFNGTLSIRSYIVYIEIRENMYTKIKIINICGGKKYSLKV